MAEPTVNLEAAQQFFAAHAVEVMRTGAPPYNGPGVPLVPLAEQSDAFRAADAVYRQRLGYGDNNFGEVFDYAMLAEHGGARMVYAFTDSTPHAAELYGPDGTFVAACVIHRGRVAWVSSDVARGAIADIPTADALFPPVQTLRWIEHTPETCEAVGVPLMISPAGDPTLTACVLQDYRTAARYECANMAEARALAQQIVDAR